MKESVTLFELIKSNDEELVFLSPIRNFFNKDDAYVNLRSDNTLKNGNYIILKVYKKENGK